MNHIPQFAVVEVQTDVPTGVETRRVVVESDNKMSCVKYLLQFQDAVSNMNSKWKTEYFVEEN